MIRNIRLAVEYDGSAYCGWQRQENGVSIQQLLEECIGRITGEEIRVVGSGRTDAGVHALRQVAHFRTTSRLGERNLLMGINSLLPADIAVLEVQEADPSFHARFSVKSNRAWFVWEPLDLALISEALPLFKGTHDFTSFCSTHTDSPNRIRTILALGAERDHSGMVHISLEADGFLRYMVRTIIGTLVDVGRRKLPPEEVAAILRAKDRSRAGLTAPAHGLFLKDVKYG